MAKILVVWVIGRIAFQEKTRFLQALGLVAGIAAILLLMLNGRYDYAPVVGEVIEGMPAAEAGLMAEDMIVAIGQYKVDGINGLTSALQHFRGGDTTTITVWRDGEELVLEITLDEKPVETETEKPDGEMPEDGSYEEWYEYFKDYFGDGE